MGIFEGGKIFKDGSLFKVYRPVLEWKVKSQRYVVHRGLADLFKAPEWHEDLKVRYASTMLASSPLKRCFPMLIWNDFNSTSSMFVLKHCLNSVLQETPSGNAFRKRSGIGAVQNVRARRVSGHVSLLPRDVWLLETPR